MNEIPFILRHRRTCMMKYNRGHKFVNDIDIYFELNRISERESRKKVLIRRAEGSQDSNGHGILLLRKQDLYLMAPITRCTINSGSF